MQIESVKQRNISRCNFNRASIFATKIPDTTEISVLVGEEGK